MRVVVFADCGLEQLALAEEPWLAVVALMLLALSIWQGISTRTVAVAPGDTAHSDEPGRRATDSVAPPGV